MTDPCAVGCDVDDDVLEQSLIALERLRSKALVEDDMDALAHLLSDDLVHVHTTGIVHDKAHLLDHAGRFLAFLNVERGQLRVRRLDRDVAIMTGEMTNTVRRRDSDEVVEVQAFVTQVWACRDGRWQIASFHATRLRGPA